MRIEAERFPNPEELGKITDHLAEHLHLYIRQRRIPIWTHEFVQDAIQEVFADPKVLAELQDTISMSRLRNIAVNKLITRIRKWNHSRSTKTKQVSQTDAVAVMKHARRTDAFVEDAAEADLIESIHHYLKEQQAAGERWADTFIRFQILEQSYKEINQETGRADNTITTDLKKAARILKNKFAS